MGIEVAAWIGVAVAAGGAIASNQQQKASLNNQRKAAGEADKARAEEAAKNASSAAQERRQQIREERVKRAQIMNQAALTGTADSSGEMGATGGMSQQLGANLGANQGAILRGQRIGGFLQNQSNFMSAANSNEARAGTYKQVGQLGGSLFGAAGGWKTVGGWNTGE